mmetsp:Transcript_5012/g.11063  ORF Transcript_5012/g.11063 Transcript_5012/m.11063 type:complete len:681 (+) Transcript_5012:117-2159(+)
MTENAVLDVNELEQLEEEAERMKALGNKHMAAQEYTRAYNAYSAALQLSPVGPSSHVFLVNRAASLLSLKRYSAAAVDARRAVALAPTFGKAHARLGQALYFLKQYAGAVEAYEDALRFEEEEGNAGGTNSVVTRGYLQKAKEKLAKQEEKERRKRGNASPGGGGVSPGLSPGGNDEATTTGEESVNPTIAYSIATDKDRVGLASGLQTNNERINAVAKEGLDSREVDPRSLQANQLPLQRLSINEDDENADQNIAIKPASPSEADNNLGSPFTTFHNPNPQSSPKFMTVKTGPMGGPAQRRVGPRTPASQPQDTGSSSVEQVASPPLKIPTPASSPGNNLRVDTNNLDDGEPDPDFDEALRLQRRATHFLAHKQYRLSVDEFSAALFLVPDDPVLTPQLHVGRAHALNGQERFESAKNDALMALKHILRDREEDASAAEAYSVLGKSLYYTKDYHGSIEALEECERIWKEHGRTLSVFDEAYLDQSREALDAGLGVDVADDKSVMSNGVKSVVSWAKEGKSLSNIPKLKPPRFVPREKALRAAPNLPPMPKAWPQQSPTSPSSIATGPERTVTFLSDNMGITLNRGTDGIVRVVGVVNLQPGSVILRKGKICAGDLVREAGGVDLRRPITATMWGDTVALIKMAPRPLHFIVAKEITSEFAESPTAAAGRRGARNRAEI